MVANQTQIPVIQTNSAELTQVQQNINKVLRNLFNQISQIQAQTGINIDLNGSPVATEPGLNFIEGTNVTITATNNVGNDRVDVTINAPTATTNSFETMNAPSGTDPVASTPTDTLNFSSSDGSVTITGSSSTKTLDFITSTAPSASRVVIPDVPCSSSINVGDWVRYDSSASAVLAQADNFTDANLVGVVESKDTTTSCNILVLGISNPIFSSLDVTKDYFLSPTVAGTIQDHAPTSSGNVVVAVGRPKSSTRIYVDVNIRAVLA